MDHDIHTFTIDGGKRTFRATLIEGAPWFRAMDIIAVLDISSSERVRRMASLPPHQRTRIDAPGEIDAWAFVNKAGANALLRNKAGRPYARWLTVVVPMHLKMEAALA